MLKLKFPNTNTWLNNDYLDNDGSIDLNNLFPEKKLKPKQKAYIKIDFFFKEFLFIKII